MTWVDGVVLAVLLISAGLAFVRGLVREVLGVGAWAGALVIAILAEPHVHPFIVPYVEPPWLATGVAVGSVFLVVLIILKLIIAWLAGHVRRSVLGGVDRALGMVFGLARGAVVVVIAYIVAGLAVPVADRWPDAVRQARSLPPTAEGARWLVAQLPADLRPRLPQGAERQEPSMDQLLRPPARGRT